MGLSSGKVSDFVEDLLGEPPWDFGAKAFGLASSDFLVEFIKAQGWAGGAGDEIIQAVAGGLMAKYGDKLHDQVPNVGRGVLLGLAGRLVRENVTEPLFGKEIAKTYYQKYRENLTAENKTALLEYYRKYPKSFAATQQQQGGPPGNPQQPPPPATPQNINMTPYIEYQVGR